MKFRSIISFSPKLRTNAVFCLIFAIFSSIYTLISSVSIQPQEKVKAIWSTQTLFVTCTRNVGKTGRQPSGELKWFRGDQEVDANSRAPVHQIYDQNKDKKLFLMSVPRKYSGIYECRHISEDGRILSADKFELKVFNAIDMEGNKDSYVGTEGGPFSMVCLTKFDADSTETLVSWLHNNNPIKNGEANFSTTSQVLQSVDRKTLRNTLTIKHLTKDDEGVYTCQSVYGNAYLTGMKSIDINLRVQFKPRFLENTEKNVWISEEEKNPVKVNVTCAVNADPVAKFYWFHSRGQPITSDRQDSLQIKHSITESENLSILNLEYQSVNEIRNTFGGRQGFQCKARNEIGETEITFKLSVGKLPESPLLANYSYENGILLLIVNETKVEPPIDVYCLEIANNHNIYFNESNRIENSNQYEVVVDVPSGVHNVILTAHNPVGWSLPPTNSDPPQQLVINSAFAVQQYIGFVLFACAYSLVNAL